jgi:hypothetical protein
MDLEQCDGVFSELVDMSSPRKQASAKRSAMSAMTRFLYLRTPWIIPLMVPTYRRMTRKPSTPKGPLMENEVLNLQAGEWVEVLSEEGINATLDEQGKYRGLRFMPEQAKFCGKRLRVFKPVRNMLMETNGEMRQMKIPTVYLEGAYCDGKFHGDCDRSCFLLWREGWLRRIAPGDQEADGRDRSSGPGP